MSMLYTFKPQKDRTLQSVSRILLAMGVTPNMVTAAGLLVSVIAGLLAASGHLYAGIFLFIIGACLDAVDGSFARACGLTPSSAGISTASATGFPSWYLLRGRSSGASLPPP